MGHQETTCGRLIKATRVRVLFASQERLAELIREAGERDGVELLCDQSTISRWERGDTLPALRYRRYLAEVLTLDSGLLFAEVAA